MPGIILIGGPAEEEGTWLGLRAEMEPTGLLWEEEVGPLFGLRGGTLDPPDSPDFAGAFESGDFLGDPWIKFLFCDFVPINLAGAFWIV